MNRKLLKGLTVVELVVVITIIGILVSATAIAYRQTQQNARNEKFKTDSMMLEAAVQEYYNENGEYPSEICNNGSPQQCDHGQVWEDLVADGYLSRIPQPDDSSHYSYRTGAGPAYGIRVPIEPTMCKVTKGTTTGWWGGIDECSFS